MIIGSNAGTGLRRVKFACVKFGIPLFNSRVGSYGGPFRSLAKGNLAETATSHVTVC